MLVRTVATWHVLPYCCLVCVRVVRRVSRKRMCTSDARGVSLRLRFAMQPVSPCETIVEVLGTGAFGVSLLLTWITCNALARNAPARVVL